MKQREQHGIGIGSASILLIFIVLTLTIFSVLTLLSAEAEAANAEKAAASVSAFYSADRAAEIKLSEIKTLAAEAFSLDELCEALKTDGCDVAEDMNGITVSYETEIDGFRKLLSVLRYENGEWVKTSWKTVSTEELEIDDNIDIWDGSELPIG